MSRSRQFVVNGVAALMSSTGAGLVGLLVTPVFLAKLGLVEYGVWALANGIVAYAGLAELGLGSTFVKSLAEYAARKEEHRVRQVMTFGTLFYFGMTALLTPIIVVCAPAIVGIFKLPPSAIPGAESAAVLVFLYALLSRALGMPSFLLTSLGYLRLASVIAFVSQMVFYAVSLILLLRGYGIMGPIAALFARLAMATVCSLVIATHKIGYVYGNPFALERGVVRHLFGMSSWIQLTDVCTAINFEADRVIIGAFVAVADVSYYDIANRLARTLRSAPLSFINAFLPAVSALDAVGDGPSFGTLYVEASRYFMLATAVLLGFLAAASSPIVNAWVGGAMNPAVGVIVLLCITYVVSNLTVVGSTMMRAIGKPRYETQYSAINASVNLVGSLIFVHPFGYYGVVLGTLSGAFAGLVFFQWILHSRFSLPSGASLHAWFWKILAGTGGPAALLWFAFWSARPVFAGHRLLELFEITLGGIVYLALCGAVLSALRFFHEADRHRLMSILPRGVANRLVARAH